YDSSLPKYRFRSVRTNLVEELTFLYSLYIFLYSLFSYCIFYLFFFNEKLSLLLAIFIFLWMAEPPLFI
ncbi:hypothetical protein ACMBCN_02475, partial [Candidatus Liberibacter asiaticus]